MAGKLGKLETFFQAPRWGKCAGEKTIGDVDPMDLDGTDSTYHPLFLGGLGSTLIGVVALRNGLNGL